MEAALVIIVVSTIGFVAMTIVGGGGWSPYGGGRGPHFGARPWEGVWLLLAALAGGCLMVLAIPIGSSSWRALAPAVGILGLEILVAAVYLYVRRR